MDGFAANVDKLDQIADDKHLGLAIENTRLAEKLMNDANPPDNTEFNGDSDIFQEVGNRYGLANRELAELLKKNRQNLELAQEAILEIADRYRAVDGQD